MSKNIQFQKVMVNGMIIEMGGNNLGCLVIGRMLNRCEGINLFTMGHNNDTAGMLTGCTSDTDASAGNPVQLAGTFMLFMLFVIMHGITVSRLICQCTNGSRTESLAFTEDNLRISMRLTLIITGEVQVNIRLFVALESKEGFERNIMSLLHQRLSAYRADPVFHITAGTARKTFDIVRIKIHIVTFRAQIMGLQGINLCNTGHIGNER